MSASAGKPGAWEMIPRDNQTGSDHFVVRFVCGLAKIEWSVLEQNVRKDKWLMAILASPKFLYRAEAVPANLAPGQPYRIGDLDLASRLAFFLWSQGPDDELLALGESGKLHEPQVLQK